MDTVPSKREFLTRLAEQAEQVHAAQRRPYTFVCMTAEHEGKAYTGCGFAKVNWPDPWSEDFGMSIARDKALADIYRQIFPVSPKANKTRKQLGEMARKELVTA